MGFDFRKQPMTKDGRVINMPSIFGDALDIYFSGRGDDITNNTKLRGTRLDLIQEGAGTNSLTWQYNNRMWIAGGILIYEGASFGDWIRYQVYAPATVGTANEGAGVYDKYEIAEGSGLYTYVPNPTQEGGWDLNLTEKLNSNVCFTKVVPIPMTNGFFDYDYDSDCGDVALNVNQTGNTCLFAFDFVLIEIVNDVGILGSRSLQFALPASWGAKVLQPHWKHTVTINHEGTGDLKTTWHLVPGRDGARPE